MLNMFSDPQVTMGFLVFFSCLCLCLLCSPVVWCLLLYSHVFLGLLYSVILWSPYSLVLYCFLLILLGSRSPILSCIILSFPELNVFTCVRLSSPVFFYFLVFSSHLHYPMFLMYSLVFSGILCSQTCVLTLQWFFTILIYVFAFFPV